MDDQTQRHLALPKHVAIIMDGNGRWANERGLPRVEGHRKGAEAVKKAVEALKEKKIHYVTLFAFSSENWQRPQTEVDELMDLMRLYLRREMSELHKSGACLKVIGQRSRLPTDIQDMIKKAEDLTKDNQEMTVQIALSYGGRDDIVSATRHMTAQVQAGVLKLEEIDESLFSQSLMTAGVPDPDLLIRTSGENRISNFLLWQCAYSEFYFTETLWPDFDRSDIEKALISYQSRDRRYGGLKVNAS